MIYEQHKIKIYSIIFTICILLFLLSPPYNQGIAWEKEAKTTSWSVATGMVSTVSNTGKTDSKAKGVWENGISKKEPFVRTESNSASKKTCNADCKIAKLIEIWIREEIAVSLVENCKLIAQNPVLCIKVWASIVMNESGWGYKCRKANKYNCFGIMQNEDYKSYHDATLHFAWKFQKWWRNAKDMSFFYSPSWSLPRSRYCTSEDSSGSIIGCPNGLRNSTYYFNKLNF